MFDIGWTEVLILAVVGLFVIGPKEIPKFLGYIGRMIAKFKMVSKEFQDTVDEAIRETELEEVKNEISSANVDISHKIQETFNPIKIDVNEKNATENKNNIKNNEKKRQEEQKDSSKLKSSKTPKNASIGSNKSGESVHDRKELPTGLRHIRQENSEIDKADNSSREKKMAENS